MFGQGREHKKKSISVRSLGLCRTGCRPELMLLTPSASSLRQVIHFLGVRRFGESQEFLRTTGVTFCCERTWARSRSIETERSSEGAVLMELGACHECASGSNLALHVDFCSQIHRVRILCGGQATGGTITRSAGRSSGPRAWRVALECSRQTTPHPSGGSRRPQT